MAELVTALFPDGVPGYDTDDGVTVETRLHPDQIPLGLREGAFQLSPRIDESAGYTSNAPSGPGHHGSWEIMTAPSLGIASTWSRDAFGALVSLQNTRYQSLPNQDRTDGTISAGGRIDIGDDKLTLAVAHVTQHEDRSQLNTIASDRPIAFELDDARASYEVADGRWSIVPSVQITNWRFSNTTIFGVPASQSYRNRVVLQSGVTMHYELAPLRNLVLVARAIGQDYTNTPPGQTSPDSTRYQMLGGIDYDDNAIWRWRILVGGEVRMFASPLYHQQNTLIAEAGATWAPSGITTVNATVSRETEDAAQEGVSGLTYSSARVTIDHEYLRNLLFRAAAGLQRADFFQGGHQIGTSLELGVTWVLNRSARLSFTFDQTDLHGSTIPTESLANGYSRGLGLVTLRLDL